MNTQKQPPQAQRSATHKNGYALLLGILVIGAVAAAITTSLLLAGITSSRTSLADEQSKRAIGYVNSCLEEALQQIHDSTPFTGSSTIAFNNGSCTFTVTSQGAQNRTISASSTVGTVVRKARVVIDKITPSINVVSWQEVADL